jgi:hypothetical protein
MLSPNEAIRLAKRQATSEAPAAATQRNTQRNISRNIQRSTEPLVTLRGKACFAKIAGADL